MNAQNLLSGPRFSTRLFSHDKERKCFISEASDLVRVGELFYDRIYADSADVGFTMVSPRTGLEATFCLAKHVRDDEGDSIEWEFYPTTETLQKIPRLAGYRVTIFND